MNHRTVAASCTCIVVSIVVISFALGLGDAQARTRTPLRNPGDVFSDKVVGKYVNYDRDVHLFQAGRVTAVYIPVDANEELTAFLRNNRYTILEMKARIISVERLNNWDKYEVQILEIRKQKGPFE